MPSTSYIEMSPAVAALQARTDALGDPVQDVSGAELRLFANLYTPGVVNPDAYLIAPGSGLSVDVGSVAQSDLAIVPGSSAGQGNYLVRIGTGAPENIPLAAAHLSNPRRDQIYIVISDDAYDAGGVTMARLGLRTGDPAGTPSAPGPDGAWTAYLLLAEILVPAGATSVDPGNITDHRQVAGFLMGGVVPPGTMVDYLGATAPAGWLLARGQAVSRTLYSALFATIGTTYGVGDGSTTFNLPDLRRRMTIGKADSGSASTLGQTGGSFDHVHAGPSHTHSGPSHTHTAPSHTHSGPSHTHSGPSHTHSTPAHQHPMQAHSHTNPNTSSTGSHTHSTTQSSNTTAPGTTGTVAPAALASHTHTANSNGSHSHTQGSTGATTSATDGGGSGTSGSGGTGATGASGTGNTGSGGDAATSASGTAATGASGTTDTGAGNPPYIVVNKLVKV